MIAAHSPHPACGREEPAREQTADAAALTLNHFVITP
jgi:hypothetical protein